MEPSGFQILYEHGPCLVVNKPPGVATQAPPGIDSLEIRVKRFLKERDQLPGEVYLGVPHRLDRPASGALVLAKHNRAARKLARQFEHREVRKTYWAIAAGHVEPAAGAWQDYVRKIFGRPQAEIVQPGDAEARLALLEYRVLAVGPWGTWLEIVLQTGRTHQVRLQASSRGHPLLGDAQYGSAVPFGPQHADERQRAIALHARNLAFTDPTTRERIEIVAPTPEHWPLVENFI